MTSMFRKNPGGGGGKNVRNRTIFEGDNLDVMRGMNSASIDLIYADPPFNSKRNYAAPIGSAAAGAAFKDTWTLSDVDEAWHGDIAEKDQAIYEVIRAAGVAHSGGMKSYLIMMAVRLIEMRRLLKETVPTLRPDGGPLAEDADGRGLRGGALPEPDRLEAHVVAQRRETVRTGSRHSSLLYGV